LESREFNVEVACDGNDAILKCARGNYSVVFSDILMPVKSGISAIKEMRTLRPNLYVIAMSGLYVGENLQECAAIFNADTVLRKPFGENEIFFALEQATVEIGR
jgi:two-component system response regulator AtoC